MNNSTSTNQTFSGKVKNAWSLAWHQRRFRWQMIITVTTIASFPIIFNSFFDFVEKRTGLQLSDPLLDILPAHNVSWTIFFFLYCGVIIGLSCNLDQPRQFLLSLQTYCLVTLFRLITITLFPLEPPSGYIPLQEPIVQMVTNGGRIISKDLFFSGHVSTILSLYFTVRHRFFRPILFMFVLMVSVGVLVQHIHYTIDVLAAPFGTGLCYWFCKSVLNKKLLGAMPL